MKILNTGILLIITLLIVPIFTYYLGSPLNDLCWTALNAIMFIAFFSATYSFIVGEITNNNSQVDKIWSLLPIIYVWVVANYGEFSPRLTIMSILVSIWGLRLTYNFSRHGAFTIKFWEGNEDYRWPILREKSEFKPRWKWTLFNLLFISGYQNALILLFTLPIVIALQFNDAPIGTIDYIATGLLLFFIIYESIADQQQWNYQSEKLEYIRKGKDLNGDYKKGFMDKGLWAYSRHPNYFAEQAIWVSFYLFSVAASGQWFNWSIAGCLLLIVLFQGSSAFSEEISTEKYPKYKEYQKQVRRFLPFRKRKNPNNI
jgi:steroid 5-alpha reductase family enzyme